MTGDDCGPFQVPPRRFTDHQDREILLRTVDRDRESEEPTGPERDAGTRGALVEMYLAFDPEDRAQGIPPVGEERIRTWLDTLLALECLNVVAWHDDRTVGHATLVPDGQGGYELAIFVLRSFQNAGVGTETITTLLGLACRADATRIWLTVERWNEPAIALYRKVGFQPTDDDSFEKVMELSLDE